jgi:hypothetical protein
MLLPISNEPQESIPMDFMTQLLKWNGMDVIPMVVNRFSKLAKMALIKTIKTTFDSIKLFFDMWGQASWDAKIYNTFRLEERRW